MKRIELIAFLRGFAIFTIVLMHLCYYFHFNGLLGKIIQLGGAGVHVFFLCSGFGLYLSYLREPLNYSNFIKKRFLKVYSPYIAAVLLWSIWISATSRNIPWLEMSSHIFLWKMFSVKMDSSICSHYWFISTILQFYLTWPLLTKLMSFKYGIHSAFIISFIWTTLTSRLGYENLRPWGSFFLQYLWEFCLGMFLAKCLNMHFSSGKKEPPKWINAASWKWKWLIFGIICGMGLNAFMTLSENGMKAYNDIPSLVGYMSCLLFVYKAGYVSLNKAFCLLDKFGYELYLVHSLIFTISFEFLYNKLSMYMIAIIALCFAIASAKAFNTMIAMVRNKSLQTTPQFF